MNNPKKATLYIDIDDEITTIIDKVTSSKEKITALVLPKRATVLQSVVNMKLLKRSADTAHKKIVLITSDPGVIPLAGIAGVHVAKTLQSKPTVPEAPATDEATDEPDEDVALDKSKTIAALSGDEEETAEIPEAEAPDKKASKKKTDKKNKKLKIPDFSKFRTKLILAAVLLVLLIGGWVMAAKVLPKADILIKTDTRTFSKDLTVSAAIDAPKDGEVVPAKLAILEKNNNQTVPATGEKNVGKKAEGEMTLTNCIDDDESHTVPAGTGFTRSGKTFVTTEQVKLDESYTPGGECQGLDGFNRKTVDVIANEGGSSFNIDGGSYNSSIAGINAYGSKMKGGTDDIKKVVSQADINKATQQFKDQASEGVVDELKAQLSSQGYVAFESTFEVRKPRLDVSQAVNDEASSVTVSGAITFEMAGVLKEGIEEKIKAASQADIDDTAQAISDTGIDSATLRITKTNEGSYTVSVQTLVTAGPQLEANALRQEILGKKFGETESILSGKAGVVDVDIEYSPFWVGATPDNEDKVTITIENISKNE